MAAFTSPSTRSSGYKITAANWNELVNDLIYLGSNTSSAGRPAVMAKSNATTALTQDNWIGAVAFAQTDEYSTDSSMHSTSTNNTRIIAPAAGLYLVTCELYASDHLAVETLHVQIRKNAAGSVSGGTFIAQQSSAFSSNGSVLTAGGCQTLTRLSANDYLEVFVLSEANGESLAGTTQNHRFGMIWQTS